MGIVLPKELLEHLRVGEGDKLLILDTPKGFELKPYDEEFAKQMEAVG